jgi:hypothetical protein
MIARSIFHPLRKARQSLLAHQLPDRARTHTMALRNAYGSGKKTNSKQLEINMTKINQWLAVAGITSALFLSAGSLMAQDQGGGRQRGGGPGGEGRGNFDPAQMEERMMERYKERLGFTSDTEWNAVKPLVQKVTAARRDVGFGGRGFGRGGRGGGGFGGGQENPEREALEQAIESNASADDIKAKLTSYRAAQKTKQAALVKAQADLQKVLTAKQEAQAVLEGLLD